MTFLLLLVLSLPHLLIFLLLIPAYSASLEIFYLAWEHALLSTHNFSPRIWQTTEKQDVWDQHKEDHVWPDSCRRQSQRRSVFFQVPTPTITSDIHPASHSIIFLHHTDELHITHFPLFAHPNRCLISDSLLRYRHLTGSVPYTAMIDMGNVHTIANSLAVKVAQELLYSTTSISHFKTSALLKTLPCTTFMQEFLRLSHLRLSPEWLSTLCLLVQWCVRESTEIQCR